MRRRPAFTLFQLLVVLAILAVLLGLLLPAVAKVRQAAARIESQNNLKQIGLACHNYHDANGRFPSGMDANGFSAFAYLLPYIEQDNLYRTIDFKKPTGDKANATARQATIKVFLSPLDPVPAAVPNVGPTNYLFNAGSKPALKDNDGLFYEGSGLKLSDITDGTSNTFMAGETLKGDGGKKAVDVRRQYVFLDADALKGIKDDAGVKDFKDSKNIAGDRCASWLEGRFLYGTFTGTRVPNDPKPDVSGDGKGGLSALRSLGSPVNVLMADGSVRAVNKQLKLEMWKLLTSRADGQPVPDF